MNQTVEKQINWRIAHHASRSSSINIAGLGNAATTVPAELSIFVPRDRSFDILALRDWLHDTDNNADGFTLVGRFEADRRGRARLLGVKLIFVSAMDAVFCRLTWPVTTM